jgi:predicted RNA methylase
MSMPKTVSISPAVADVLRRSTVTALHSGRATVALPPEQLDRLLYEAVDKVLRALGGKWNRSKRVHDFADGLGEQLSDVLAAGRVVDQKKSLEQFYTPADLAARMVRAVDVGPGDYALEPSAGTGSIVKTLLAAGADVVAIEIDPRNAATLAQLGRDFTGVEYSVEHADFLTMPPLHFLHPGLVPSVVVMNPPFSNNQDIAHVTRAFDMLAPGGRLAAIMSPHFTFAKDKASIVFRHLIGYPERLVAEVAPSFVAAMSSPQVEDASVNLLPAGTFREAGTNVSTVLVVLKKAAA